MKILAHGLGFPEGPVAMPDGSVILTEIRNGRCSRVTADGKVIVVLRHRRRAERAGDRSRRRVLPLQQRRQPLCRGHLDGAGAASRLQARLYPAARRTDRRGDARSTSSATATSSARPTTSCSTPQGGFYFTDLGKRYARHRDHGGVYYALPDGSKITCLAYPMLSPNGCGLSPDGRILYVADTESARLWAFDIVGPGAIAKPAGHAPHSGRVIGGAPGPARFDSLAVLHNGNIAVATLTTGKITEFAPSGTVVREVAMPDIYPTNICFGGSDMRTAYITLSDKGQLGTMRWPEPGLRLNFT